MALNGIQIFKLTPKSNCKKCGFPTCMAFSMKVATGAVSIEQCPDIAPEAIEQLAEATAPPMKTLTIGKGDSEKKIGGETVLFRHEKTFVNRPLFAVQLSDDMSEDVVKAKVENIKNVNYERIGEQMNVEVIALKYAGDKDKYLQMVDCVKEMNKVCMLVCEDVEVAKEAISKVKDENPILMGANVDNSKEMIEVAKANKVVLGIKSDDLEEMYGIVEEAHNAGHKDIILNPGSTKIAKTFENNVEIRRTALVSKDRVFGYPTAIFANELSKGDAYLQTALASTYIMKYGSIVVLDDISYAAALPIYGLRQNIYTDPQKPMRVEPKVYEINKPNENSPVIITVDFALTYFVVSGEVERSKVPTWLVVPDSGGLSVLTSWAAGKFSGSVIANMIKESGMEDKVSNKRLIIPGKVAVLKGDIEEELPGWEIIVGPDEALHIPKFLNDLA